MRRVWHTEHGGPEVLRVEEAGVPEPAAGEVLIAVEAAGVTLPGLQHLSDLPLPQRPGGELAGRVVAVGTEVDAFEVGRHVAGLTMSGALAEYAVAPVAMLDAVPDGVSSEIALTIVRSGLVALAALRVARFEPGESVLVTAAAGGVGHLAVQLARALGAGRVVGTVSDPAKADFVRAQGADEVVLSNNLTGETAVDVVVEGVGGSLLVTALDCVNPFGRLITLSAAPGEVPSHSLLSSMRTASGLSMGLLHRHRPDLIRTWRAELWRLFATGDLTPAIAARYPLEQAPDAYRMLSGRANLGKIVLVP